MKLSDEYIIIPVSLLEEIINRLKKDLEIFQARESVIPFTEAIRRRLHGTRARRYGFIITLLELARVHPQFAPVEWDCEKLEHLVKQIDLLRGIEVDSQALLRMVKDQLLMTNTEAYP